VKRWLLLSTGMLASLIVVAALALYLVLASLDEPLTIANEEMTFVIEPGASFTAISNALAAQGIISKPRGLRIYTGWRVQIKAGHDHTRHDGCISRRRCAASFFHDCRGMESA
jgi:cell division protein YceG involved in septum cleavage